MSVAIISFVPKLRIYCRTGTPLARHVFKRMLLITGNSPHATDLKRLSLAYLLVSARRDENQLAVSQCVIYPVACVGASNHTVADQPIPRSAFSHKVSWVTDGIS